MEYCCNGDLLDLINKHIGTNQKGIGEELSRKLFRQLCEALQHIHMNGVVHRYLIYLCGLNSKSLVFRLTLSANFAFQTEFCIPDGISNNSTLILILLKKAIF